MLSVHQYKSCRAPCLHLVLRSKLSCLPILHCSRRLKSMSFERAHVPVTRHQSILVDCRPAARRMAAWLHGPLIWNNAHNSAKDGRQSVPSLQDEWPHSSVFNNCLNFCSPYFGNHQPQAKWYLPDSFSFAVIPTGKRTFVESHFHFSSRCLRLAHFESSCFSRSIGWLRRTSAIEYTTPLL